MSTTWVIVGLKEVNAEAHSAQLRALHINTCWFLPPPSVLRGGSNRHSLKDRTCWSAVPAHRQPALCVRAPRRWRRRRRLKGAGLASAHRAQVRVWLSPPLGLPASLPLQGTHTARSKEAGLGAGGCGRGAPGTVSAVRQREMETKAAGEAAGVPATLRPSSGGKGGGARGRAELGPRKGGETWQVGSFQHRGAA